MAKAQANQGGQGGGLAVALNALTSQLGPLPASLASLTRSLDGLQRTLFASLPPLAQAAVAIQNANAKAQQQAAALAASLNTQLKAPAPKPAQPAAPPANPQQGTALGGFAGALFPQTARMFRDLTKSGNSAGAALGEAAKDLVGFALNLSGVNRLLGGLQGGIGRTSGAGVAGKAFEVLGATVGIMLTPIFIRLGVAALDAADALKEIMGLGGKSGLKEKAAEVIGDAGKAVPEGVGFGGGGGAGLPGLIGGILGSLGGRYLARRFRGGPAPGEEYSGGGTDYDEAGRDYGGDYGPPTPAAKPGAPPPGKRDNLADIIAEMKRSLVQPPGYSTLTDIRKQAQLASAQSPLEQRVLDLIGEAVKSLDAIKDNTKDAGRSSGGLDY